MFFQPLIGAALALAATAYPTIKDQQPVLNDALRGEQVDLIKEFVFFSHPTHKLFRERADFLTHAHRLEKANIIPTILDPFGKA